MGDIEQLNTHLQNTLNLENILSGQGSPLKSPCKASLDFNPESWRTKLKIHSLKDSTTSNDSVHQETLMDHALLNSYLINSNNILEAQKINHLKLLTQFYNIDQLQ